MLLEALYPLLTGIEPLQAVLKGGIHVGSLPEGVCRPVMSYSSAGGSSTPTFDTSGMQKARLQFDAFGVTRAQAAGVLDVLRQALNGYVGTLPGGLHIQNIDLINPEPMDFPVEEYARDFRCMSEYYVWFCFP